MLYNDAAEYLKAKTDLRPRTAVILGTGMQELASKLENAVMIPYSEIPGFPTVGGESCHRCRAVIGCLDNAPLIFMQGRLHYYEGYSMPEIAFPIHMLRAMGIETLILTNAAGAVNQSFSPGDIILITDHIKLAPESPMRGHNDEKLGDRFFDMCDAYSQKLQRIAYTAAEKTGIILKSGVYAYMTGPQFETPAEIKMLGMLGADLVGMSTVPEVIAAAHCGLPVLALSCVTNMGAGIDGSISQAEIDKISADMRSDMILLLREIIKEV